jgi:hypothetical protein
MVSEPLVQPNHTWAAVLQPLCPACYKANSVSSLLEWTMQNLISKRSLIKVAILLLAALVSGSAIACACCSFKGTWDATAIKPKTYHWEVFESLRLGSGQIRSFECEECDLEKNWDVFSVSRTALVFRFNTKAGDFIFRADPNIGLKRADIDFNEDKEQQASGHIRIYHEIVLKGYVSMPVAAAKEFSAKPVRATLVLRGMGLDCFESGAFKNWLLRVDTNNRQLKGSGPILENDK